MKTEENTDYTIDNEEDMKQEFVEKKSLWQKIKKPVTTVLTFTGVAALGVVFGMVLAGGEEDKQLESETPHEGRYDYNETEVGTDNTEVTE